MTERPPIPTDEDLSAFLDGEADEATRTRVLEALAKDAATAARLAELEAAGRALSDAAGGLLAEAPKARMEAHLAELLAATDAKPAPAMPRRAPAAWRPAWLAAAALMLLVAGVAADRAYLALGHEGTTESAEDESAHWREAVARYFELYTADTFAGRSIDPEAARPALERVGGKLGLPLTPADVTLADANFAGAILFGYDGFPLAQIAYVDPESGPMALCIIALEKEKTAAPKAEVRDGMNIVFWAKGGHAFMLIGHAAPERIAGFADVLRERFG